MTASVEQLWEWLAEVPDPEIPVISVVWNYSGLPPEEMRRELESALNRDIEGGALRGKVDRIRLLDLAAGPHALSARFRTDGELRYDLH